MQGFGNEKRPCPAPEPAQHWLGTGGASEGYIVGVCKGGRCWKRKSSSPRSALAVHWNAGNEADCRLGRRESTACAPAGDFAEDPRLPRKVRGLLQVVVEVRDPAFIDPQAEMNGQQLIKHSPGLGKICFELTSIRQLPGFQFGFCLAEVDGPVLRDTQGVAEYPRLTADFGDTVDEPFDTKHEPARP